MMANKFMYVCFGMLALVVAFHLGARHGQAGYVHHSDSGIIALGHNDDVLLDDGEVWRATGAGWETPTIPYAPWPVPVSQIKFFYDNSWFISTSDELWSHNSGQWVNYGTPPGGAATGAATWGAIKATWKENE